MNKLNLHKWQQKMLDEMGEKSKQPLVYIGGVPPHLVSAMYYALIKTMVEYSKKHEKK